MLIRDPPKSVELDRVKEVKVKIPLSYHVRLHSMKVLTGKQISDAVKEALDAYFTAIEDGRLGAPWGPPPAPGIAFPARELRDD